MPMSRWSGGGEQEDVSVRDFVILGLKLYVIISVPISVPRTESCGHPRCHGWLGNVA